MLPEKKIGKKERKANANPVKATFAREKIAFEGRKDEKAEMQEEKVNGKEKILSSSQRLLQSRREGEGQHDGKTTREAMAAELM